MTKRGLEILCHAIGVQTTREWAEISRGKAPYRNRYRPGGEAIAECEALEASGLMLSSDGMFYVTPAGLEVVGSRAPMKAITICQPYAELIARGEKRIENRTWPTSYRGPIAIHAGKSKAWLNGDPGDDVLVFGAVVAIADLVGCKRVEDLVGQWAEHAHAHGPWCWMLSKVRRLEPPVPARGAQGLWEWTR